MNWKSDKPIERDTYLCAIKGENIPYTLIWTGEKWECDAEFEEHRYIDNSTVLYYCSFEDIPMPDNWYLNNE